MSSDKLLTGLNFSFKIFGDFSLGMCEAGRYKDTQNTTKHRFCVHPWDVINYPSIGNLAITHD